LTESHQQGESPIIVSRKGTGGNSHIHPIDLKMILERPTPGGYKSTSAPGQSKSPSVRRTRRDDFELDSSSDERDRAYMHDLHIRDSDIRAGYAFPREPGLPHSGVLASKRGKETHDNKGEMSMPNIRAVAPSHRENVWQERGVVIPLRGTPEGAGVGNILTP
jgi:hypothetical protein